MFRTTILRHSHESLAVLLLHRTRHPSRALTSLASRTNQEASNALSASARLLVSTSSLLGHPPRHDHGQRPAPRMAARPRAQRSARSQPKNDQRTPIQSRFAQGSVHTLFPNQAWLRRQLNRTKLHSPVQVLRSGDLIPISQKVRLCSARRVRSRI